MLPSPAEAAFLRTARRAFPYSIQATADGAAKTLLPLVDDTYRVASKLVAVVQGREVRLPERIHFHRPEQLDLKINDECGLAIQCLCTRSTDGYLRQSSLRRILSAGPYASEPWVIPFVVLLSGEYVVEIIDDLIPALMTFNRDAYVSFVRENRSLMRRLRSKATSYWNCYYRITHPRRSTYPGLVFLRELEVWAA